MEGSQGKWVTYWITADNHFQVNEQEIKNFAKEALDK